MREWTCGICHLPTIAPIWVDDDTYCKGCVDAAIEANLEEEEENE